MRVYAAVHLILCTSRVSSHGALTSISSVTRQFSIVDGLETLWRKLMHFNAMLVSREIIFQDECPDCLLLQMLCIYVLQAYH